MVGRNSFWKPGIREVLELNSWNNGIFVSRIRQQRVLRHFLVSEFFILNTLFITTGLSPPPPAVIRPSHTAPILENMPIQKDIAALRESIRRYNGSPIPDPHGNRLQDIIQAFIAKATREYWSDRGRHESAVVKTTKRECEQIDEQDNTKKEEVDTKGLKQKDSEKESQASTGSWLPEWQSEWEKSTPAASEAEANKTPPAPPVGAPVNPNPLISPPGMWVPPLETLKAARKNYHSSSFTDDDSVSDTPAADESRQVAGMKQAPPANEPKWTDLLPAARKRHWQSSASDDGDDLKGMGGVERTTLGSVRIKRARKQLEWLRAEEKRRRGLKAVANGQGQ